MMSDLTKLAGKFLHPHQIPDTEGPGVTFHAKDYTVNLSVSSGCVEVTVTDGGGSRQTCKPIEAGRVLTDLGLGQRDCAEALARVIGRRP